MPRAPRDLCFFALALGAVAVNGYTLPTLPPQQHAPINIKMALDLAALAACFGLLSPQVVEHPWLLPLYAPLTGTVMWMNFVVGHDCGHGSFSDNKWINAVVGHLTHTPLLVPFWPWAFSHRLHHQYHNHRVKDRSYPWFDEDEWAALGPLKRGALKSIAAPFYLFPAYLFMEAFDGCHFWPFSHLYSEGATSDRVKCVASTATVVGFAVLAKEACGSWGAFAQVYLPAYFVFAWWLFTVTYLQHHDKGTKVYDEDWTFVKGATETIDRTYGMGIDKFHHHITDGHVAHHLFSRQIPHYHLEKATAGVRSVLRPPDPDDDGREFLSPVSVITLVASLAVVAVLSDVITTVASSV